MKISHKTKFFLPLICSIFLIVLLELTSCMNLDYLTKVYNYWGVSLPKSMSLLYRYENKGFEDGMFFYVYGVEADLLSIEFNVIDNAKSNEIDTICKSFFKNIDKNFSFNWEHSYGFFYKSKDNGNKYLYLIYDNNLSRLTIIEVK